MSKAQPTTTRRRVLQRGAAGALAAGLLGAVGPSPQPVDAEAPHVLPGLRLVDESHLIAESEAAVARYREVVTRYHELVDAFVETLTDEQGVLWDKVQEAHDDYRSASNEMEWAEVKRHLPIMAVALDIVRNEHGIGWLGNIGVCCASDPTGGAS